MKKNIKKLIEDRAIMAVHIAEREYKDGKGIRGDIDELLREE